MSMALPAEGGGQAQPSVCIWVSGVHPNASRIVFLGCLLLVALQKSCSAVQVKEIIVITKFAYRLFRDRRPTVVKDSFRTRNTK